jgi:outer membrane protein assembly factor BamB
MQGAGEGLHTLEARTGRELWSARFGSSAQSCPVLVGKAVYLADIQGMTYALG